MEYDNCVVSMIPKVTLFEWLVAHLSYCLLYAVKDKEKEKLLNRNQELKLQELELQKKVNELSGAIMVSVYCRKNKYHRCQLILPGENITLFWWGVGGTVVVHVSLTTVTRV